MGWIHLALLCAALTSHAFETALPGVGAGLLALCLSLFAFSTILGWAYYAEKCWEFMLGTKALVPFRIIWTIVSGFGALVSLDFIWLLSDTLNAFMAIPNLLCLILLSPLVFSLTKEFLAGEGSKQ